MSLTSYQTAPPRAMFGLRPATAAQPVRVPGENAFAHRNQVVGTGRGPANRGPMSGTLRPATPAESAHHGLARPGSDLLSHALRRSTIGAEGLHGRVRDGIGCFPLAITTRPCKHRTAGAAAGLRTGLYAYSCRTTAANRKPARSHSPAPPAPGANREPVARHRVERRSAALPAPAGDRERPPRRGPSAFRCM